MQTHYILFLLFVIDVRFQKKEMEIEERKEQLNELVGILRHTEGRWKKLKRYIKQREQVFAASLVTPPSLSYKNLYLANFTFLF